MRRAVSRHGSGSGSGSGLKGWQPSARAETYCRRRHGSIESALSFGCCCAASKAARYQVRRCAREVSRARGTRRDTSGLRSDRVRKHRNRTPSRHCSSGARSRAEKSFRGRSRSWLCTRSPRRRRSPGSRASRRRDPVGRRFRRGTESRRGCSSAVRSRARRAGDDRDCRSARPNTDSPRRTATARSGPRHCSVGLLRRIPPCSAAHMRCSARSTRKDRRAEARRPRRSSSLRPSRIVAWMAGTRRTGPPDSAPAGTTCSTADNRRQIDRAYTPKEAAEYQGKRFRGCRRHPCRHCCCPMRRWRLRSRSFHRWPGCHLCPRCRRSVCRRQRSNRSRERASSRSRS
jgi:hypothetical protein